MRITPCKEVFMGIIIGIMSWALSALICLVPPMFLPEGFLPLFSEITFWLTSAILFVALWFTLIWKTRDIPKALVFFAAEWAILLVSALFFLIKFGDVAYMFDPYGSSALLFYLFLYSPLAVPSLFCGIAIILLPLAMFSLCIFFIVKHYRETGDLW